MTRFHLKPFLEQHQISAYQLVRATKGKLSESTVYSMSREPLKRIDLDSVQVVVKALQELTGESVQIQDLIENQDIKSNINPRYAHLIKKSKPMTKHHLQSTTSPATPEELEQDKVFWLKHRQEQLRLQIAHESDLHG